MITTLCLECARTPEACSLDVALTVDTNACKVCGDGEPLLLSRHALSLSRRANARDLGVPERWVCTECDGDGKDGLGEPNACTVCTGDGMDRCRHSNVARDCDDCAEEAEEARYREEEREDREARMCWLTGRTPEWAVP